MAGALTIEQLFDSIAIRVNGPEAWSHALTIDWDLNAKHAYRMTLSNGALTHRPDPSPGPADRPWPAAQCAAWVPGNKIR